MSAALPLSSGWRLSAPGLSAAEEAPSFLPGADRLSGFGDLLGEKAEESRPFSVPGLIPAEAGHAASLFLTLTPAQAAGDHLLLHFPLLRGKGRILADGNERLRFQDGALDVKLSPVTVPLKLTLEFEDERPAGIPAVPVLRRAENAWLDALSLEPGEGEAVLTATAACVMPGSYELSVQTNGRQARSVLAFSLNPGEPRVLRLTHPLCRLGSDVLIVTLGLRRGAALLPCDRRVLCCGPQAALSPAWLPLSVEEAFAPPGETVSLLRQLQIPGVQLPAPAAEAMLLALGRAGIRAAVRGADDAERLRLSRIPGLSFREDPPPSFSPADAAWQLCGLCSCPRTAEAVSREEMLLSSLGKAEADAAAALPELLARIRADGMRLGLYSGPAAPEGALTSPRFQRILRRAAGVHVAAFPLFGAWWCSSRFSCRIAVPGAPAGCHVTASLQDRQGHTLFERTSPAERPFLLETALPDQPCVLRLRLMLTYPDGSLTEEEPLPVFVGLRAPLEALTLSGR
ncbi:MAG: hypothetical protein IJ573_07965 [Clostridia bacterium]|nr:hypothetical protein [Clostridia bacterium]